MKTFKAVIEVKYKKTVIVSGKNKHDAAVNLEDMIDNRQLEAEQLTPEDWGETKIEFMGEIEEDF